MKKILAVVLAGAMTGAMGATDFAAGATYESQVLPLGYSHSGKGSLNSSGDVPELGEIIADEVEIEVTLGTDMFKVEAGETQLPSGTRRKHLVIRSP